MVLKPFYIKGLRHSSCGISHSVNILVMQFLHNQNILPVGILTKFLYTFDIVFAQLEYSSDALFVRSEYSSDALFSPIFASLEYSWNGIFHRKNILVMQIIITYFIK